MKKGIFNRETGKHEVVDMTAEEEAKLVAFWAECQAIEAARKSAALQFVEKLLADPAAVAALKAGLK